MTKKSYKHLKSGKHRIATKQFHVKREQGEKSNSASSQSGMGFFLTFLRWGPTLKSLWEWIQGYLDLPL